MANNRLYIVNTNTKEYLCVAKNIGGEWKFGNEDLFRDFLAENLEFTDKTAFIIGTENDDDFYINNIKDGINFNKTNKWEYTNNPQASIFTDILIF